MTNFKPGDKVIQILSGDKIAHIMKYPNGLTGYDYCCGKQQGCVARMVCLASMHYDFGIKEETLLPTCEFCAKGLIDESNLSPALEKYLKENAI